MPVSPPANTEEVSTPAEGAEPTDDAVFEEPAEATEATEIDHQAIPDPAEATDDAAVIDHMALHAEQIQRETTENEEEEEIEDIGDIEEVTELTPVAGLSPSFFDPEQGPVIERFINFPTARVLRPASMELIFDHRARENFFDKPFDDFLGFDAGSLKIGLGVRFGISDGLERGISRLGGTVERFDAYDLDVKYQFLRQDEHFVDLALRVGGTWFAQPDMTDAAGGFAQLAIDRELFDRLLLGISVLAHTDSSAAQKRPLDDAFSLAIGGMAEFRFLRSMGLTAEVHGVAAGYNAGLAWTVGLKAVTWAHTFALVFSNTQYVNADGLAAGTSRGLGDVIFGFSITREIRF